MGVNANIRKLKYIVSLLIFLISFSISLISNSEGVVDEKILHDARFLDVGTSFEPDLNTIINNTEICFKIPVKKGCIYQLLINDIEQGERVDDFYEYEYSWYDFNDPSGGNLFIHLVTDNNNEDDSLVEYHVSDNLNRLFRASSSGYYYLYIEGIYLTKFSIQVKNYNIVNKKYKDNYGETYKITNSYEVELVKPKIIKNQEYQVSDEIFFEYIDGIRPFGSGEDEVMKFQVTSIGKYAFKGSNIGELRLSENIKHIGVGAFQNCSRLGKKGKGVEIYGNKVIIESKAFYGCKNLKRLFIYKWASIKSVKKNAFKGTKRGFKIEVPSIKKYKKLFKKAGFKKPKYLRSY